ncbi:MAG: RidA family protein [Rikenellaceae bacterium]
MKRVISTTNAPAAVGPYSQAIEVNGTLYVSGQIALDPATGVCVEGGIEAETHRVFANIGAILAEAGYGFEDVVKSTVLLDDISDFVAMNDIYATYFVGEKPARACFEVAKLPKGVKVEIEVIAVKA